MAPFAVDLYLPTFPQMSEDLASSTSGVQLTLTAFLVGIAAGQFVFGILSDRFGRRGPLLIGMIACVAAGVIAAGAPTIEVLIGARAIQGFSGAAGVVISRAIVVDLVHGNETARSLSLMAALGGIAPVAAPMVGGLLSPVMGWRGMMVILAVIAFLMLLAVIFFVPETYPRERRQRATRVTRESPRPARAEIHRVHSSTPPRLRKPHGVHRCLPIRIPGDDGALTAHLRSHFRSERAYFDPRQRRVVSDGEPIRCTEDPRSRRHDSRGLKLVRVRPRAVPGPDRVDDRVVCRHEFRHGFDARELDRTCTQRGAKSRWVRIRDSRGAPVHGGCGTLTASGPRRVRFRVAARHRDDRRRNWCGACLSQRARPYSRAAAMKPSKSLVLSGT